ncbi:MAG: Uncharacterized protein G01um101416_355 [Microgenomates group bacterium Gr01-1014_16]|nr:MAG: Uncharacterized protein G01um101416_355 [Microgenomates group bacterium Gr01-1014_16]
MKWINRLYIFFLGIILTITTGFGVAAFYPQPVQPVYPFVTPEPVVPESCNKTPQEQMSPECQAILQRQKVKTEEGNAKSQQFDKEMEAFRNKDAAYTRTAVFFGIAVGALFAILGIAFIKKSKLVATGLLLASVCTAILTRLLVRLASLGSEVGGTSGADTLAFVEFGVLFALSVAVIMVGQFRLTDQP